MDTEFKADSETQNSEQRRTGSGSTGSFSKPRRFVVREKRTTPSYRETPVRYVGPSPTQVRLGTAMSAHNSYTNVRPSSNFPYVSSQPPPSVTSLPYFFSSLSTAYPLVFSFPAGDGGGGAEGFADDGAPEGLFRLPLLKALIPRVVAPRRVVRMDVIVHRHLFIGVACIRFLSVKNHATLHCLHEHPEMEAGDALGWNGYGKICMAKWVWFHSGNEMERRLPTSETYSGEEKAGNEIISSDLCPRIQLSQSGEKKKTEAEAPELDALGFGSVGLWPNETEGLRQVHPADATVAPTVTDVRLETTGRSRYNDMYLPATQLTDLTLYNVLRILVITFRFRFGLDSTPGRVAGAHTRKRRDTIPQCGLRSRSGSDDPTRYFPINPFWNGSRERGTKRCTSDGSQPPSLPIQERSAGEWDLPRKRTRRSDVFKTSSMKEKRGGLLRANPEPPQLVPCSVRIAALARSLHSDIPVARSHQTPIHDGKYRLIWPAEHQ
ncbi:hypothetical protein ACRALDRAFT_208879 [Sodiomyces alcalophilus JCM 7366]|uniref:uncharacterized protein n=1 Tax=Sodiomyces alcalophilus JCM 7366 TaxID=591952 RepID=UPI0039B392EF